MKYTCPSVFNSYIFFIIFIIMPEWDHHYAALLEYGKQHGHCNVPQLDSYTCVLKGMGKNGSDMAYSGKLGTWVSGQRKMKKGTESKGRKLTPDREALLQKLVNQGTIFIRSIFI